MPDPKFHVAVFIFKGLYNEKNVIFLNVNRSESSIHVKFSIIGGDIRLHFL